MAVTFVTFHEFPFNLGNGAIDLDSHAFKAVLSNTTPSVAIQQPMMARRSATSFRK